MIYTSRLAPALGFVALALGAALWLSPGDGGYGLGDFLRRHAPPPSMLAAASVGKGGAVSLTPRGVLEALDQAFSEVSEAVLPAVVSITTEKIQPGRAAWHPFFGLMRGRAQAIPGLGSGAIISAKGLIVTNYHVIDGVNRVTVMTQDKRRFGARILGASRERDIALLQVEGAKTDFPFLKFADSDKARVGQIVFAVGNPFGLSGTVTQGIVSARDRHLDDSRMDYLQTDTVINPGNSGGPLVNLQGEIIGINVAIYRGDENVRAWQGVGLAVPANDAKWVVDSLQSQNAQNANAAAGYLGLRLVEPALVDRGLGAEASGALVAQIETGSPAQQAGLMEGDVIVEFNGRALRGPHDLLASIKRLSPGTSVRIGVVRGERALELEAVIGGLPNGAALDP